MTRDERLVFCKSCTHKGFDPEVGIVCGLTQKEPDFDPRCPSYQPIEAEEKPTSTANKRFWKRVAIWTLILVTAGALGTVGFIKWREHQRLVELEKLYNQFTEDEYIMYAEMLEGMLKRGDQKGINAQVDQDYLRDLILSGIYTDYTVEEMLENDIYRPGKYILSSARCVGAQIDFIRYYRKGVVPHLIYRTYCENSLNYFDFTLGISGGKLMIQDMFSYASGQSFTEDIEILINEVGGIAKDEQVIKWSRPYRKMVSRYQRISIALSRGDYLKAKILLSGIPEQFHKYPSYQNVTVRIASFDDTTEFESAVATLVKNFPDMEGVAAYHGVHRFRNNGDTVQGLKAIRTLRDFVGHDPVLDIYEGHMRRAAVDLTGAQRAYREAMLSLPDCAWANWYDLEMSIILGDVEDAATKFWYMRKRHLFTNFTMSRMLYPYRDFLESPEFLEAYHKAGEEIPDPY
ncbi:MAG: hypothetical protein H6608_04820 [Flavobacteriales bacterium]|nr:hypothetical protein [Bacteroidota bacterium]MCB9240426.1 hypothetical protein [Flavobacteriales bacterium]